MPDADEAPKSSKSSAKKRKAEDEGEDSGKKKMKLNLNKGSKTPNGESAAKSKASKAKTPKSDKKAAKEEPQMSEEDKYKRKQQATLYCRHKLQKAFLTNDAPPKDEEMPQMAKYFEQLEKADDIDAKILRDTKIHKVMKGIVKLGSIPRDEEFHFKERSQVLLDGWSKLLGEPTDKPRPATANGEKKDEPTSDAAAPKPDEDEKAEEKTEPVEQTNPGNDAQDEATDTAMPDASASKDDKPTAEDAAPKDADAPAATGTVAKTEVKAE